MSFSLLLLGAGWAVVEPLSGVASVTLPATPAVFRGVSCRRLPFGGYVTFLAPVACPASAVELCCWVCGVLGVSLGFLPGVVLFLRDLRLALLLCRRLPLGGFLTFLTPSACPTAALVA